MRVSEWTESLIKIVSLEPQLQNFRFNRLGVSSHISLLVSSQVILTHWARVHSFRTIGLIQTLYLPDQKTGLAKLIELAMLTHRVSGCTKTRKTLVSQMLRSEPFPGHHNSPLWIWVIWYNTEKSKWIYFNTHCHSDWDKRKASLYASMETNFFQSATRVQIPSNFFITIFNLWPTPELHLSKRMAENYSWNRAKKARLIVSERLLSQQRQTERKQCSLCLLRFCKYFHALK